MEWPVVLVPWCSDGMFPSAKADEEGRSDEERRLFYVVVTQQLALTAGVALLPAHLDVLLALLILNSSLLAGHYYAVGKGRFFDAWFNVSLLLVVALGVVNYVF